ncbi:MAG: 50S ribosomal protein L9 [Thermoleophilia bacterium]|nr:50S ribosomal protein L9 [Thermoleophilia bacterium]
MDVILLEDVEKVGLRGEVVSVARGYMRNFLAPRRLAEPATPARVAELQKREAQRARQEARSLEQAGEIAETLRKTVLRFEVHAGPRGRLFGSITATDIADELWRTRRIRVDRRKVDLPETLKRVGRYDVPIDVFEGVRVEVKTLVVPEGGELPPDEELAAWEEEERAEAAAAAGDGGEQPAPPGAAAEAPATSDEGPLDLAGEGLPAAAEDALAPHGEPESP